MTFGYTRIYGAFVELLSVAAQHVIPVRPLRRSTCAEQCLRMDRRRLRVPDGRRLAGVRAGWLAAALLLCMPRYMGDSMNNTKDVPFAVLMLAAFYSSSR